MNTELILLKATARALAMLVKQSPLYAESIDIRMGVMEVMRLTEPRPETAGGCFGLPLSLSADRT